jgi:hypothetical protein
MLQGLLAMYLYSKAFKEVVLDINCVPFYSTPSVQTNTSTRDSAETQVGLHVMPYFTAAGFKQN